MALTVNGGARKKVAMITGITGNYLIGELIVKVFNPQNQCIICIAYF